MAKRKLSMALVLLTALGLTPASADVLRSEVAFNTGIGKLTSEQPAGGVRVAYEIAPTGDLDGCHVDIVESVYARDSGAWGVFDVRGNATCPGGGFAYLVSGAFDENGFHGSGIITEGSGGGTFAGLAGRVSQAGGLKPTADGTFDVAYRLLIDAQD